jgi:(E)-4-hydroxy-3-methylbut-2-enyl-diphosphate synthase
MVQRRVSKAVRIGDVTVGGDAPIAVQSMTKTDTRDVKATVKQIKELEEHGCEIIRCAVPDMEAATALAEIKKKISIPLVADIHFDYRLALEAINSGVDGLRLNPGNIGEADKVTAVVNAAKEREVPIRIGVNAGSLPQDITPELPLSQKMVVSAMRHIKLLENLNFDLVKVSLKAFNVPTTIEAYKQIAEIIPYPLHIGITESGPSGSGIIRSACGISPLLYMGIGDTIRVSLSADPVEEVITAYEILKSLDLRHRGAVLVSCPTCGRTEVDLIEIVKQVEERLAKLNKPITVAVMGCVVNGPGEAKDADIGIACGKGKAVLFRRGEKICTVDEKDFVDVLMKEVEEFEIE